MPANQLKARLGLSRRKHLPAWRFESWSLKPWSLRTVVWINQLKISKPLEGTYRLEYFGKELLTSKAHMEMIVSEYRIWKRYYPPPFPLNDKTVLDAGAGCGETAVFYLAKGAKKIISVESDPSIFKLLKVNVNANSLNVDCYNESFSEKFMVAGIDFAKIDVEGAEISLLNLNSIEIPCLVETHGVEIKDKIQSKFPQFREVFQYRNGVSYLVNWSKKDVLKAAKS